MTRYQTPLCLSLVCMAIFLVHGFRYSPMISLQKNKILHPSLIPTKQHDRTMVNSFKPSSIFIRATKLAAQSPLPSLEETSKPPSSLFGMMKKSIFSFFESIIKFLKDILGLNKAPSTSASSSNSRIYQFPSTVPLKVNETTKIPSTPATPKQQETPTNKGRQVIIQPNTLSDKQLQDGRKYVESILKEISQVRKMNNQNNTFKSLITPGLQVEYPTLTSKKLLRKFPVSQLKGKRVLVRCDLDSLIYPNGSVIDSTSIQNALPTINYLSKHGAKIILMTQFGLSNGIGYEKENSVEQIVDPLSQLLNKNITFVSDCIGLAVAKEVVSMKDGDIVLLENLRFHQEELLEDSLFSRALANQADFFINDAFVTILNPYSSTKGVPQVLATSMLGFSFETQLGQFYSAIKEEVLKQSVNLKYLDSITLPSENNTIIVEDITTPTSTPVTSSEILPIANVNETNILSSNETISQEIEFNVNNTTNNVVIEPLISSNFTQVPSLLETNTTSPEEINLLTNTKESSYSTDSLTNGYVHTLAKLIGEIYYPQIWNHIKSNSSLLAVEAALLELNLIPSLKAIQDDL